MLVERRLRELVTTHDSVAYGPVHSVMLAPSKRFHAAVVLTSARAVDLSDVIAIELAAAIELVHAFSLVHADIEEGAQMRRGRPTVHAVDGVPIAVNAGNALHVLACSVMLGLDAPPERTLNVARVFAIALERMVAGQARALIWTRARRRDLRHSEYVEMVRGKTGALFGFAAAAPAALAGHAGAGALFQLGEELGIALQLADDVAVLRSVRKAQSRPLERHTKGALSGPTLLASEHCDGSSRAIELAHHHIARAREHLDATGLTDTTELDAFVENLLAQRIAIS